MDGINFVLVALLAHSLAIVITAFISSSSGSILKVKLNVIG